MTGRIIPEEIQRLNIEQFYDQQIIANISKCLFTIYLLSIIHFESKNTINDCFQKQFDMRDALNLHRLIKSNNKGKQIGQGPRSMDL